MWRLKERDDEFEEILKVILTFLGEKIPTAFPSFFE
jgi:hypothetical protein